MKDGVKIFRDPIYDIIYFDKELDKPILQIIDTPEFQRLRRIKQLGLSNFTFSSSNHDRFSHSIGVCFLAGLMVDNLNFDIVEIEEHGEKIKLDKAQVKLLVRLAAILHDIGHGPFSHAFERAIKEKIPVKNIQIHEDYTIKIIESDQHSISQILKSIDDQTLRKYAPKWIRDILSGAFLPIWIKEIISSQFDADRLDYLLRDAYICGVKYAGFDWQWLFQNMFIGDIPSQNRQGILFDGVKGIHSLESFVVSRYHMYEQVYFHKTTRGFEAVVNAIFKRLNYLIDNQEVDQGYFLGEHFMSFLKDYESINDYLFLDDYYMISHFHHWINYSRDEILQKLCLSFAQRHPFKLIATYRGENFDYQEIVDNSKSYTKKIGLPGFDYYYLVDDYKNNPYKDNYLLGKKKAEESELIWLKTTQGIQELSNASMIINALRNNEFKVTRIFVHIDFK